MVWYNRRYHSTEFCAGGSRQRITVTTTACVRQDQSKLKRASPTHRPETSQAYSLVIDAPRNLAGSPSSSNSLDGNKVTVTTNVR
jgi:hypothetical protein